MAANETTSKRVAAIAGAVLERMRKFEIAYGKGRCGRISLHDVCSWNELKTIAGSCLTQATDKPKKK